MNNRFRVKRFQVNCRCVAVFLFVFFILNTTALAAGKKAKESRSPHSSAGAVFAVDGFRSARFGMSEREVLRAIYRDFRISKPKVKRDIHPTEKTVHLEIAIQDLLPDSGPGKAFYILGYQSQRLIQVNVVWGKPVTPRPDAQQVVNLANQLRDHFAGQEFQKKGLVTNAPLGKDAIVVFRGQDGAARTVLLLLNNPKVEGQPENQNITLKLSYIQNPEKPDVFQIKEGEF